MMASPTDGLPISVLVTISLTPGMMDPLALPRRLQSLASFGWCQSSCCPSKERVRLKGAVDPA